MGSPGPWIRQTRSAIPAESRLAVSHLRFKDVGSWNFNITFINTYRLTRVVYSPFIASQVARSRYLISTLLKSLTMPPRHQTLPPAQTSSAREAQKAFYCNLCSKGYSRMNEPWFAIQNAGSRARKAEAKADGLISIKLPGQEGSSSSGGGGFKKGGFKKSGFKSAFTKVESSGAGPAAEKPKPTNALESAPIKPGLQKNLAAESDTEDEGYEVYDPRFPTD
ncbi:hypothetical protein NM208_g13738 [Fusarium decemcellulare]|uniref:Uncharacterized protein n=1 Tax=Fusarium decemcellulare TaxID=57161 RepID=A0ACC1RKN9_9HYPO|nr:hypothetical protein NM208_g13738 [Fusarium decemcellulare]